MPNLWSTFISFRNYNFSIEKNNLFFFKSAILYTFILSLVVSLFAIYKTELASIFLIFPLVIIYLYRINFFSVKIFFSSNNVFLNFRTLFYLLPIYLIQFYLNYDFTKGKLYLISDDIYDYASTSYQLVHYGIENRTSMFSIFYPELFKGVQPYHYFELWLNGLFSSIFGGSYAFNLLFFTYPILIWIYILVLLAIIEHFKLLKYRFILLFVSLFVGPNFFGFYDQLFNGGNFFDSSVFTIPGFVKQTLVFSFYGQKHLPVYIFSGLLILGILKFNFRILLFSFCLLLLSSVGVFPGVVSGFFLVWVLLFHFQRKYIIYALPFILVLFLYVLFYTFFGFGVSEEVSIKTNYFSYFLTNLNWKGEFIRIIEKLTFPFIWFLILYFPYFLILYLFKIPINKKFKTLIFFIIISYFGGALFTLFLYGLNSDQFVTNLLPIYNISCTCFLLYGLSYLIETSKQTKIFVFFVVLCFTSLTNIFNLFSFHFTPSFKRVNTDVYSLRTQNRLITRLKIDSPKYIAVILSPTVLRTYHPAVQYPFLPAKYCFDHNFFNYLDLNFPYYKYKFSSASNIFSPRNQMKYYLKNKNISKESFEKVQLRFLKENKINWIFCSKGANLPLSLFPYVTECIFDSISKEHYYRILLSNFKK